MLTRLSGLSVGTKVLHWATDSASGGDGLGYLVDGAQRRSWWMVDGRIVESIGDPLPGEPDGGFDSLEPHDVDEWSIVGVVEALVDSWERLLAAEYRVFAPQ
jgi:hypothetical protein